MQTWATRVSALRTARTRLSKRLSVWFGSLKARVRADCLLPGGAMGAMHGGGVLGGGAAAVAASRCGALTASRASLSLVGVPRTSVLLARCVCVEQGVLLPGLGKLEAGEVYRPAGASQRPLKGRRVTFTFAEAFSRVPQIKPELYQTGPRPVTTANYAYVAQRTGLGRAEAQRALRMCFEILSQAVLAGARGAAGGWRPVSVALDGVCTIKLTRKGVAKVVVSALLEDALHPRPEAAPKAVEVAPPPLRERAQPKPPSSAPVLTAATAPDVFLEVCANADRVGSGLVRAVDVFKAMAPGQPLQGIDALAGGEDVAAALERNMTPSGHLNYHAFARTLAKALQGGAQDAAPAEATQAEVVAPAPAEGLEDGWEMVEELSVFAPVPSPTRFSRQTWSRAQVDEWNAQQIAARKQLYEAGDGVAPKVGTGAYVRASIDFGYHTHWSNNGMPPTHVQRAHARTAEATAGVGAVLKAEAAAEHDEDEARREAADAAKTAYAAELDAFIAARARAAAEAESAGGMWPYRVPWDAPTTRTCSSPRPRTAPAR